MKRPNPGWTLNFPLPGKKVTAPPRAPPRPAVITRSSLSVRRVTNTRLSPSLLLFPLFYFYYVIARAFINNRAPLPSISIELVFVRIFPHCSERFSNFQIRRETNIKIRNFYALININVSIFDAQESRHLQLLSKMRAKSIKSSPSTCASPQNPHPFPLFEKKRNTQRDQRHLLDHPLGRDKRIARDRGSKRKLGPSSRGGGEEGRDHGRGSISLSSAFLAANP